MKTVQTLDVAEERAAAVFRAMGNPARIKILRELAARPGCVTGDLVGLLPLAQSTVSEHLSVLKEAGLVRGVIDGDRCYCLDPGTLDFILAFCDGLKEQACAPEGSC